MTTTEKEQRSQSMSLPLPSESFRGSQRTNWDTATPLISDAPLMLSPPPRLRPIPKPSNTIECQPNDIERLSLPLLSTDDLPSDPLISPQLPLNIIPRRSCSDFLISRRSHSTRNSCGNKRTRPTGAEKRYNNGIFNSATIQYSGISGKTIYADPVMAVKDISADGINQHHSFGKKKDSKAQGETFYFPAPRFTQAARSALPHVLQLSD